MLPTNQYVHGMLDRFCALQLLDWGENGRLPKTFAFEEQRSYLKPLNGILRHSGCEIDYAGSKIVVQRRGKEKVLVVFPGMLVEPRRNDTIYVSDAYIKYAKPYALQKILNEMKGVYGKNSTMVTRTVLSFLCEIVASGA